MWEYVISLLSGGAGVFLIKFYADWRKAKRGDQKDAIGAWQEIADRESVRYERLENRATYLEKIIFERDHYVMQLEHIIINAGLALPDANRERK